MNGFVMEEDCSFSLIEALLQHAENKPDTVAYHQVSSSGEVDSSLTYGALLRRSQSLAAQLLKTANVGDRAVLLLHGGPDFVIAFMGCLLAGIIAVPGYPVRESNAAHRSLRHFERLISLMESAQPSVILSTGLIGARQAEFSQVATCFSRVRWIIVEGETSDEACFARSSAKSDVAFLQYTSGSIAMPKGVMVTQGNLLSLFADMQASCQHDSSSVMVTWIPVYHDMGLIYGILLPLYFGFPIYALLPAAVLQQPARWLQAVSRYRGTHGAAPNFAYDLCVQRVSQSVKETLDLSCWQVSINGAEPVRPATLQRFNQAFAGCGVRDDLIRPGYGLAECTLKVTSVAKDEAAKQVWVDGPALEQGRLVLCDAASRHSASRCFQSCGRSHINADIRIVDPFSLEPSSADRIGEIWVSSASVAPGYWRQPDLSAQTMGASLADGEGPFLRTGDLGFILDQELYIAGRLKDLIVIHGRNIYPQDIEACVEQAHVAVRPGRCCVFGIDTRDSEGLVLVAEVERTQRHALSADEALGTIREAVAQQYEVQFEDMVFVRTGTFPLTSSGKVQRRLTRDEYRRGTLDIVAREHLAPQAEVIMDEPVLALRRLIIDFIAGRLHRPPEDIVGDQSFNSQGLDSIALLELTGLLEERLACPLPASLTLDYPDSERLSRYLAEHFS